MTEPNTMRLAILIDAENVQPVFADTIFSNAQAMGEVCAREIFGAASALTTWVEPVLKYAIHPNLTIKAAKGKNSSDIALVIGAMDLVVGGNIDGVVIASSDSDFSSLSVRLRTAGLQVIGMGTEKANALWRTACSTFMVLETPAQKAQAQKAAQPQKPQNQKSTPAKAPAPQKQPAQTGNVRPAANASHKERAAVIEQAIQKWLNGHGGRVQVSNLFPVLKKLPEYNRDRQDVGKKPLNYLTSTFGENFDFAEAGGKLWVSVKGWRPAENAQPAEPEPEAEEAPETEAIEVPEALAEAEALVEEVSGEPAEAPAEPEETPDGESFPAAGPEPEPEPEEAYQDDEAAMATRMLVDGGMEAEVAATIVGILRTASDKRAAYNAIRKVYGSTEGRNYYNQAKEILENRG